MCTTVALRYERFQQAPSLSFKLQYDYVFLPVRLRSTYRDEAYQPEIGAIENLVQKLCLLYARDIRSKTCIHTQTHGLSENGAKASTRLRHRLYSRANLTGHYDVSLWGTKNQAASCYKWCAKGIADKYM